MIDAGGCIEQNWWRENAPEMSIMKQAVLNVAVSGS